MKRHIWFISTAFFKCTKYVYAYLIHIWHIVWSNLISVGRVQKARVWWIVAVFTPHSRWPSLSIRQDWVDLPCDRLNVTAVCVGFYSRGQILYGSFSRNFRYGPEGLESPRGAAGGLGSAPYFHITLWGWGGEFDRTHASSPFPPIPPGRWLRAWFSYNNIVRCMKRVHVHFDTSTVRIVYTQSSHTCKSLSGRLDWFIGFCRSQILSFGSTTFVSTHFLFRAYQTLPEFYLSLTIKI